MKTSAVILAVLAQVTTLLSADAQQADTVVLGGVVISATKAPVSSTALTQSVTVISGEELRARGVTSVAEALRGVPGVAVAATGSYGALTSVFVRGGESRYTKFLVDGVAVNAVGGLFDAAHLSTANIERIEIVRGPSSVVHGADAVSGVVQIFTKHGSGPAAVSAGVRGGTYGTLEGEAGVSGSTARTAFAAHGARNSTDGILAFNNEYLNETFSGSARIVPSAGTSLAISARATHAIARYPTDFIGNIVDSNSFRDQRRVTLALDGARSLASGVELRILGGMNDATDFTDDVSATPGGDIRDRYTSHNWRYRGEGRLTAAAPGGRATAGVEYQRERERSRGEAGPVSGSLSQYSTFAGVRATRAAYAEYLGTLRGATVNLSGRVDDPSDFARAFTYRIGSAVGVARGLIARASLSTSYNAPAFFYLFDTDFTTGNPDLDPETARTVEASLEQQLGSIGALKATFFDQRFNQLIEYVPGGAPDFVGTYANLAAASSRGHEIELTTTPYQGWSAHASYTALRAAVRDLSADYQGGAAVGDELLRRPRRSGTAGASFEGRTGTSLSLVARYIGKRPDLDFRTFPSPRITLPSATIVDVAAIFPLPSQPRRPLIALTVRVDNALDKSYQEVFNFDAPGRRIMIGGRIDAPLR